MVSENFADICMKLLCSLPTNHSKSKEIFLTIYKIFSHYRRYNNSGNSYISVDNSDKVELLFYMSSRRSEDNSLFDLNDFIDRIQGGKFKGFIQLLKDSKIELSEDYIDVHSRNLLDKLKVIEITKSKETLESLFDDLEQDNYGDYTEIIEKWESGIKASHADIQHHKKQELLHNAISLNLKQDSFQKILEKYRESYKADQILKTGFPDIDNKLPLGGLEKRRIYLFAGESGAGKSTLLMNIIKNAILNNETQEEHTFLWITAENLIDETLIRFYCCLTGMSSFDVMKQASTDDDFHIVMKSNINRYLDKYNVNVLFHYVESGKSTVSDIEAIVHNAVSQAPLKAVFMDYLDLVRCETGEQEYRRQLGSITKAFKNIAVTSDVVFLTATQLNSSGYNSADKFPVLTSVKESMEKVDHCDFVAFLQRASQGLEKLDLIDDETTRNIEVESQIIKLSVLKNRNGPTGFSSKYEMRSTENGYNVFNYSIKPLPKSKASGKSDEYDPF